MILLRNASIVTMDARRRTLRGHLLIRDGRIEALGSGVRAPRGAEVVDCAGKAVIPGLVQAHVHLCQTLFRNRADGLPLLDWLEQRTWPLEAAHDERSLGFSARLGLAELLLGGTTAILDMATVQHTEAVLRAAARSGIRYTGGKCLMDIASGPLGEETGAALAEAERLGRRWHGRGLVRWALCPRFALSCSEAMLRAVARLSEERGWLVHTHASENVDEERLVRERTGRDNISFLSAMGLRGRRTVLAHCVHVKPAEARLLARDGTHAVHCPGANLKLASGVARVPELLAAGVNVALGGDGAACNNTLDAFHEMRLAATLHLPRAGAQAMPAAEVLAMATVRGARALGLEDEIGSLEPGKRADVAVVDLSGPHCQPSGEDVHATVVYCARASDVTDVFVDGRPVVRGRKLLTLDARKLAREAAAEAARLAKRMRRSAAT
jgi:cytosine/adenosine deaminase-related metal-dependent hydrolase